MLIRKLPQNFGFLATRSLPQYVSLQFFATAKNEYDLLLGILKSKKLLDCKGDLIAADAAFKRKPIIAYYFSASWCVPCKVLLPKIKDMYKTCHAQPNGFELIYVSMDEIEEIMVDYFKNAHGCDWFALPFGDPAREHLLNRFDIENVPQIIVVKVKDGSIITKTARKDIEELGKNVLAKWNPSN